MEATRTVAAMPTGDYKDIVGRFELGLISRMMQKTDGNKTRAADELGIKRTTLVEKLKKLKRELV